MNVRIDLNNIKLIESVLKSKANNLKLLNEKAGAKSDVIEISRDSLNLKDIDVVKSTVSNDNNNWYFNVVYNTFTDSNFSINGFVKREEKLLEINFKYEFLKDVVIDGKKTTKKYNLDLHLSASFKETISYKEIFEKEDILRFIQKLVKKIFDAIKDDSITVSAVIIDKEDLDDIAQIGNKEFSKLIQTLISSVISIDRYKKLSKRQPLENEIIHMEREKRLVTQIDIKKVKKLFVKISESET